RMKSCATCCGSTTVWRSDPLLGVHRVARVILADDDADVDGGVGVEILEFETRPSRIRVTADRLEGDLDVLAHVDEHDLDLHAVLEWLLRLQHHAASPKLAQDAQLLTLLVGHIDARLEVDLHPLKAAAVGHALTNVLGHRTDSGNENSGSTSTGTSLTCVRADCNSEGILS